MSVLKEPTLYAGLGAIALVAAGATGWIMNIYKLFHMAELSGEAILRTIGIFVAPLGAVAGYF